MRYIALLIALIAMAAPAAAADLGAPRAVAPWQGPACDDPSVLAAVQHRFDETEATYWEGARMVAIDNAREVGYRDWHPTLTARRYCAAHATLSNGHDHELVYWLRSDQGFAGWGWGFQYCLIGRDRFNTYAPWCRVLRPKRH